MQSDGARCRQMQPDLAWVACAKAKPQTTNRWPWRVDVDVSRPISVQADYHGHGALLWKSIWNSGFEHKVGPNVGGWSGATFPERNTHNICLNGKYRSMLLTLPMLHIHVDRVARFKFHTKVWAIATATKQLSPGVAKLPRLKPSPKAEQGLKYTKVTKDPKTHELISMLFGVKDVDCLR